MCPHRSSRPRCGPRGAPVRRGAEPAARARPNPTLSRHAARARRSSSEVSQGSPGGSMIHANNNLRDGEADDARLGGEALPEPRAGLVNDVAAVVGRLRRHVPVIRKMAVERLEVEHHVHLRRRAWAFERRGTRSLSGSGRVASMAWSLTPSIRRATELYGRRRGAGWSPVCNFESRQHESSRRRMWSSRSDKDFTPRRAAVAEDVVQLDALPHVLNQPIPLGPF